MTLEALILVANDAVKLKLVVVNFNSSVPATTSIAVITGKSPPNAWKPLPVPNKGLVL